jgi:hypothetical protein
MGVFEYLAVLISIVVGLGLTHLLVSITRAIHARHSARVYWVQLVWALNLALWLIAFWWFTFALNTVTEWTYGLYVFLIVYAVLLYLLAALLFPHDPPDDQDYESHFFTNRRWFYGTLTIFAFIDIVDFFLKVGTGAESVTLRPYLLFIGPIITLSVAAIFVERRSFHAFFSLLFLVWVVGMTLQTLGPVSAD